MPFLTTDESGSMAGMDYRQIDSPACSLSLSPPVVNASPLQLVLRLTPASASTAATASSVSVAFLSPPAAGPYMPRLFREPCH